jgi:hypothetical protein
MQRDSKRIGVPHGPQRARGQIPGLTAADVDMSRRRYRQTQAVILAVLPNKRLKFSARVD